MKEKKQSLSWNMKKNIVLAVCSLVLVATMVISLWEQSSTEQIAQVNDTVAEFAGKNIEQTSTTTNLYMNYGEVEQGDVQSAEAIYEDGGELQEDSVIADDGVATEKVTGPDESKNALVSSRNDTSGGSGAKKTSKAPSVTYKEVSDVVAQSGPKKAGKSKNRVVSNNSKNGEPETNRVVKNPEPLNYVEKIFSNHGTAPVIEEVLRKYQYPVEIGYVYHKNYDGSNEAGDFILNKVFDTEEADEDSVKEDEESREEDTEKEDVSKEENSEESEEETLQNEVSGDAVVEERVASGDAMDLETSGDAISKEQKKLEEYRKDVWKKIMPTKPADVEIEKKVMKTTPVATTESKNASTQSQKTETKEAAQEKTEIETSQEETVESDEVEEITGTTASGDAIISDDTVEESETTTTVETEAEPVVETESVAGYYIIKGKMREGSTVYVSDIEILPVGVDGFDKVRMGEDGEFKDSITLTEDAMDREIQLYFTDGETVTESATFTYSKDTVTPEVEWIEEQYTLLESKERKIYCTKEDKLPLRVMDGEEEDGETLERIQYLYGTNICSVEEGLDEPALAMKEDFFGRLLTSCRDKAGNVSDIQSQFVLVDHNEPVIQMAQDARCSAPYSLWVNVEETGHIVSGIQTIQCVVDGNIYEVSESVVRETYTLDEGLEVSSKLTFPIELTEVGIHAVSILVRDYAGNETVVEQSIEVTEPELVSIYMPKNFTIHIDPQQLAGKEQIYSDNVELKNVSKFDVRVNIDQVVLNVNDEVSPEGILKDCDIYLIAPDTGEKIKLSKGENEDVYSYRLPMDAVGDLANLRFVGTTTKGSERLWKGSDISLSLQVSFVKWEEE